MTWTALSDDKVHELTTPARVIEVGLDGFGISDTDTLFTADVSVCTGVALLPEKPGDKAALLHVFANSRLFAQGEEQMKLHARHLWHRFTENLDGDARYHAVIFGGQKNDAPIGFVSELLSNTLMEGVQNSGFITSIDDKRFSTERPMTAAINPQTRQFALAEDYRFYGMDDLEDAPRHAGRHLSSPIKLTI